jgi:hypothetical protein
VDLHSGRALLDGRCEQVRPLQGLIKHEPEDRLGDFIRVSERSMREVMVEDYGSFGIGVEESTHLSCFFIEKKPPFTTLKKPACIPKLL